MPALGHGKDLIEEAGCPRVASAEELAAALHCLLFDEETRRCRFAAAERFVENFCGYFAEESRVRSLMSCLKLCSVNLPGRRCESMK